MKERPILFSAPMVRAILAGTKTQTRRLVKPQPVAGQGMVNAAYCGYPHLWLRDGSCDQDDPAKEWRCPYGQPGDRLWVRETWQVARETIDYETGGEYDVWEWPDELGDPRHHLNGDARFGTKAGLFYAADGEDKNPGAFYDLTGLDNKTILRTKEVNWRPSIHMPRWASRITLEITSVRAERLQDISEVDAVAEGIRISSQARRSDACYGIYECLMPDGKTHFSDSAYELYRKLWEQINGPGSWDANPWVWVVEFKHLKGGAV